MSDAAERRQLTVMFCDLVESTALSGQLDLEDYREVVRAYQATCAEVIQPFDCHIAPTLSDGLLVYSGYPVAHENDAERAVRTGLGILTAMQTLNERLEVKKGLRLAVRVGIHTGAVVVGEVGAGTKQEQLYVRALDLCQQVEGTPQHFSVLLGLGTIHQAQGKLQASRQMREQLLHLAQEQHDSVWLLQAHLGLGATLFWLGEFVQARMHFEQAIRLYDPNQVHVLSFARDHPIVSSLRLLAGTLWRLGYPDQALKWSQEAVRLAQGLDHLFSLAFALAFAAVLHQCCREVPLVQEHTHAESRVMMEGFLGVSSGFP